MKTIANIKFIFICLIIISGVGVTAQDSITVAKERIRKEIIYTQILLEETDKNTQISTGKLELLDRRISSREEYIQVIKKEMQAIHFKVSKIEKSIEELDNELNEIKLEYEKMIFFAYRNRSDYDKMMFILSAQSFNQAYRRLRYLQQYAEYRKNHVQLLVNTKNKLYEGLEKLYNQKTEKQKLIKELHLEKEFLAEERDQHAIILDQLSKQKDILEKKLEDKKSNNNYLQNTILGIIKEEIQSKKELAQKHSDSLKQEKTTEPIPKKRPTKLTAAEKKLIEKFAKKKGKLPWPLKKAIITSHFGVHEHPILPKIQLQNNGIDLSTNIGSKVHPIYMGIVSQVVQIPGNNYAVLIKHNEYYTLYSNLIDITVRPGQVVYKQDEIGTVFTDTNDDNRTTLQFQIWYKKQKLNPEEWLKNELL